MTKIRKMQTAAGGPLRATPQMTTENVKHVANRLGEYFLKGMGAVGRFLNAGFTSPTYGTNGQVNYARNAQDAKRQREQLEASEQAMGKAMTWISPLNYGAALATGNGLNARKGEEEVASWAPAWQAVGRLGELYVGPKAVKGVKSAPRAVINTAAKAGVKPAKAAIVAREIKQATKNKPNLSNRTYTEDNGNYTLFSPFGEDIGNLLTTKPLTSEMKGKGISMIASKNKGKGVSEDLYNIGIEDSKLQGYPGLESGHDLFRPKLTMHVTDKFPKIETPNVSLQNINGKWQFAPDPNQPPIRLLIGNSGKPIPSKIQELTNHRINLQDLENQRMQFNETTGNFEMIPKEIKQEPSTSLKFFERKPSKLTEAERAGVPKGDRNQPFKQKQLIEHVQGDEAIKMFKEYGGEPIPENSYLGKQLQEYVKEARVRYGLENDSRITDKQIAEALYKEIKEQTGLAKDFDTNEPIIGFRGDTQRYTQLKERPSPEKLSTIGGTMDNSLGNLFLGEWPEGKRGLGIDRYIVTARPEQHFAFQDKIVSNPSGSGTGATFKNIKSEFPSFEELFKQGYFQYPIKEQLTKRGTSLGLVYKVKPEYTTTGVNDINAFIFKGVPRESSFEIQVGNQGRAAGQLNNFNLMTKEKPVLNTNDPENLTYNWKGKEINILDDSGSETGVTRELMKEHYSNLLRDAKNKNQGLLVSGYAETGTGKVHPFRDEHGHYTYIALPNFNIQGAKHLLPYDLRIKRNWKDKNIYRTLVPIAGSYTLYNLLNNQSNNQQLEYRKQGGKMNIIDFLKKGSGIHIKKENRGKFTDYCGGKVTSECIAKGKASSNPAIRKRATFAANARKWKHKDGGTIIKAQTGLKTAPLVKDRYKNGRNYSFKLDASPYGYSIESGTMTDNPLMFQGNIAREITYLSDGTPTDTIYWETPPTLLPVRTKTRGAGRKAYFDKPYMGDSILYKVLQRRYDEAQKLNYHKQGGILKGQYGLITDVDRRRDTTGEGIGSIPFFGAAKFGSSDSPLALFYGSKEGGPQPRDKFGPQIGVPEILPGRINKGVEMIEKNAPNLFELINKFPSVAKDIVTKNIRKWKEFFRTGDKNILKSFESNAESILNARNIDNVTYERGFIKGSEVAPKSGTQPLSETGLSIRETRLGNMENPPTNPAEKLAVQDWNKMNPENQINAQLPTGRPSYELKLEGFDPIDIRYPKQAQPLQKKLNSPIQKIKQKAPKKTTRERYQEKKETPSKNQRLKDKYNQSYEDGDLRHTYSGNSRMKRLQKENDWEQLDNYYPFQKEKLKLLKRQAKLEASGKFQGLAKKQWMKDKDALIERFRNTYRFKKGGKAFHTGVNVLDSNLKMSKAASKKVKKAEDGTKINTFQKIGNFLNSDTGKAIGSTLMNGISAGFQAKQMNDAIKQYELASKSKLEKMMNGILADDSNYQEALQQMLLTKDENENISDTVVRAKAYDIAKQKAQKKLNDYKDEINQNIVNMKQYANEQTINNFSGIFNQGMSGVMSLLNKKQTVDNGAPSNSYFDNYVNSYFKKFGTFNSDGSMNMLGGTFTIKDGYKPNRQQLFNYEVPKLNTPDLSFMK